MPIDTAKVAGRRELHFATLQDIVVDLDDISKKRLRALGNWTPGQIYQHLATAMNYTIDGFPFTVSWPFRIIGKLFIKKRLINDHMAAGFRLPAQAAKALIPPPTTEEDGLRALRNAICRLQNERNRAPSPFLGKLSREESDKLQC